jgi:hypothetical protein
VHGKHVIYRTLQRTSAVQTMSIYAKSGINTRIQLACGGSYLSVHAYFDLTNGTITAQGAASIGATITPGPNGFYRRSMTLASNSAQLFILWLITSPTSPRSEGNTTAGSVIVAAPQVKIGSRRGRDDVDGASSWSTIDRPEWTSQITYSNSGKL